MIGVGRRRSDDSCDRQCQFIFKDEIPPQRIAGTAEEFFSKGMCNNCSVGFAQRFLGIASYPFNIKDVVIAFVCKECEPVFEEIVVFSKLIDFEAINSCYRCLPWTVSWYRFTR